MPALRKFGVRFLVSGTWDPVADQYGALPFIYGTLLSRSSPSSSPCRSAWGGIFINEFARSG